MRPGGAAVASPPRPRRRFPAFSFPPAPRSAGELGHDLVERILKFALGASGGRFRNRRLAEAEETGNAGKCRGRGHRRPEMGLRAAAALTQ